MGSKVLITTAIDYTNDVIHLGHAYQKIVADVLARYYRTAGKQVYFLTGTDEYGETSLLAAQKADQDPKAYVDVISQKDRREMDSLNISYDRFIRTTDADHAATVKEFWQKVYDAGDIYFGEYQGLYCVGCESFKTVRELKNGKCLFHPIRELEKVTEKNYFFRWQKYAPFLKQWIGGHPHFIQPPTRRAEMLSFLEQGLTDIPVSRAHLKWGLPVPNDPAQTVYVWFDALINYYTGARIVGFWDKDTTIIHIIGKDNTRWHTLLWPAMLKSAGLRLPDTVFNHSFLTLSGQKISKTLGNIIRPTDLTTKYGADAVRYYLLKYGPLFNDADVSSKKLEEIYESELVNGLGNHVARVLGLAERYTYGKVPEISRDPDQHPLRVSAPEGCATAHPSGVSHRAYTWKKAWQERDAALELFNVSQALAAIWEYLKAADGYVDSQKPWALHKEGKTEELNWVLYGLLDGLQQVAWQIYPFLPETSQKIAKALKIEKLLVKNPQNKSSWTNLQSGTVLDTSLKLFPRRST